jgi:transcriptional regulator with XRE-family HTH domain
VTVGEAMRKARKKQKMSVDELARKSGYHSSQIWSWENDTFTPRLNAIIDIADALGISIDELVGHSVGGKIVAEKILTDKQIEWAYTRWCEGYTLEQIGVALCVCSKTVRRAINGRPRIRPILKYEEKEGAYNDT